MDIGQIGTFQILRTLGSGAHSTILQITRNADGKQYALKVVPIAGKEDRKFLAQAELEIKVGKMLGHPNLIKVYTLERQRDWLFRVRKAHLLLEYVNGKTLDTMKGLSIPRLVQIFQQVAAGLVHMHRRGVCHADLKPNNLMLSRTGEVKIIDYGLAWIKGHPKGRVQGTPEYMAPEQARSQTVSERSDLYNFGATMYRLLTWRLPPSSIMTADGIPMDKESFRMVLKPANELMPGAPPALCELIHACLQYDAEDRPERVSTIVGTLDQLVHKLVKKPEDRLESMEW